MRILRLDLDTGDELDLHPYVTVVGGLGPAQQRAVVDELRRIARGDVDGVSGLVESHGLLVDLDPVRIAPLGLPADADVVVRAEQLPGARLVADGDPGARDRALYDKIATGEAEIGRITEELARVASQIDRFTSDLDHARRSVDEFAINAHESALRSVEESEALARRRIGSGGELPGPSPEERRRAQLAERLDGLRRRHDDLATLLDEERLGLLQLLEQLEAERSTLDELRQDAGAADVPEPLPELAEEPDEPSTRVDPEQMAAVHAAIREVLAGPPDAPMVASLPAAALADQVAAHRQRQLDWRRELAERGLDPEVVQQRLEAAMRVEATAAEEARPRTVRPEDDREIERLHDIVTENADKRESRRHGKEATRRYEEASAELDALLERCGFPTYADYIIGRTTPSVDEAARTRHHDAKQMVANLERELAEIRQAIEQDPHGRMLDAEADQLRAAAEELLGGPVHGDLEDALRSLHVPGEVDFDAPDRLRELLRRQGVDVSGATTTGRLVELADRWYTEAEAAHLATPGAPQPPGPVEPPAPARDDPVATQEAVVASLFDRSVRLDAELTEHESEFDRQAAEIATLEAELVAIDEQTNTPRDETDEEIVERQVAADPTVQQAREQAALTGARLERHRAAVEQVDRLHAELGDARATERRLTAQRDSLRVEVDALRGNLGGGLDGEPLPPVRWTLTEEGVDPVEWYLLGRVASLRSVSIAGSVPLVLDDAFRGLGAEDIQKLCSALARIGETVQVIYLGDEPAIAAWATGQGLDRAAVVRPGQPAI